MSTKDVKYSLTIKILDINYKEDVILAMQSVGIFNGTCIEGEGLERALNDELSLFQGFFNRDKHEGAQLVISALIGELDQAKGIVDNLRAGGIPVDSEKIIRLFVSPVEYYFS